MTMGWFVLLPRELYTTRQVWKADVCGLHASFKRETRVMLGERSGWSRVRIVFAHYADGQQGGTFECVFSGGWVSGSSVWGQFWQLVERYIATL